VGETAQGVIIRVTKLTETSLIVRWSTAEFGIIDTVAKGARKPGSPLAGKIDLFFGAEIGWQRSRRSKLHHLRECAVRDFREGLRRDYPTTMLAGYCCGLIDQVSEPDHPQPEMHDLLCRALDHLQESGASLRALRHFERELARLHGVGRDRGDAFTELADIGASLPQLRSDLIQRLR
jgi:DNA repair protein RecO (recombination protein O)